MSLIHRALKKTEEQNSPDQVNIPELPVEEFVGNKKGFLSPRITPTTIVLVVVLILAVVYTGYTRFFKGRNIKELEVEKSTPQAMIVSQSSQTDTSSPAADQAKSAENAAETAGEKALPEAFKKLTAEAKELFAGGKLEDALAKFGEADKMYPDEPSLLNNMGLIYKKMNNLEAAEKKYMKALEKNPNYAECLNNLGVLKAMQGAALDAALYLKKAIELKTSYADPYFNLAVLMESEGNYKSAIENYKLFLKYAQNADSKLLEQVKERIEEIAR